MIPAAASSSQYFGLNDHSFLNPWLLHCSDGSSISKGGNKPRAGFANLLFGIFCRKLCENERIWTERPPPWIRHCIERLVPIITDFTAVLPPISCIFQIISFHCHWSSHRRILRFTTRRRSPMSGEKDLVLLLHGDALQFPDVDGPRHPARAGRARILSRRHRSSR